RQVLAHQRVGTAARLAELAAGNLRCAFPQQSFEAAQVQAEPPHTGPRQPQFAAGAGLATLAPGGIAFFAHAPSTERKKWLEIFLQSTHAVWEGQAALQDDRPGSKRRRIGPE